MKMPELADGELELETMGLLIYNWTWSRVSDVVFLDSLDDFLLLNCLSKNCIVCTSYNPDVDGEGYSISDGLFENRINNKLFSFDYNYLSTSN